MIARVKGHCDPEGKNQYTISGPLGIEKEEDRHEQLQTKYGGASDKAHESIFGESKVQSKSTRCVEIMIQSLAGKLRAPTVPYVNMDMSVTNTSIRHH